MVNAAEDSVKGLIQEGVTWVDSAYQLDPTIAIDTVSFRDTMNSINAGADIVDLETLEGMAAMNLMLKVMLILVEWTMSFMLPFMLSQLCFILHSLSCCFCWIAIYYLCVVDDVVDVVPDSHLR